LRNPIRNALAGDHEGIAPLRLGAVNRGEPRDRVRRHLTPLDEVAGDRNGVILMMQPVGNRSAE
jgi:hypothetical protein